MHWLIEAKDSSVKGCLEDLAVQFVVKRQLKLVAASADKWEYWAFLNSFY